MINLEKKYTIKLSDIDINQHTNHFVYFREASNQRIQILENIIGISIANIQKLEVTPVLLKEYINYKRETFLNEKITIQFSIIGASPKSTFLIFKHLILKNKKICAEIIIELGFINLKTRKLSSPPPQLVYFIKQYQEQTQTKDFTILRETSSILKWSLSSQ